MEKTLALAGSLAGAVPEIMDNLNLDVTIRKHAQMTGAPEAIMRDEKEVEKLRKARAEQQAQEAQMQQAAAMAGPLKDGVEAARLMSEIKPEDNSLANIMFGR